MNKCNDCVYCREIVFEQFGKQFGCAMGMPQRWGVNVLECEEYNKEKVK